MRRMIKYILYLMFVFPLIIGCSEDLYRDKLQGDGNGELPIEFELMLPDAPNTRGDEGEEDIKTSFINGDMIHILGTFTTNELQESGVYKKGKLSRYGALKFDGKNWLAVAGSNLTWPTVAIDGEFKAYYISGSNGVLTNIGSPEKFPLSGITLANDPLEAKTTESIVYGHAVKLDFNHICANLILIDLEPQVATSYWFKQDDDPEFNNAFQIFLGQDDLGPTLNFEFCRVSDAAFDDLVYISTNTISTIDKSEKVITKASYLLEPRLYETFSLCYQASDSAIYDYLKYDYNAIPENVGGVGENNTRPDLEAGKRYELIITKSPGVTITSPSSGGGWDDEGEYYDVDVKDFLEAVYDKKEYTNKEGTKILEETANGVKLLHNVDFDFTRYKDWSFDPNIMEGVVFEGDYHYIKNLASPLFRYNYGTIQNVGIDNIKISETSYEDTSKDMSRYGALCMWNRQEATISNVRVSNVEMSVSVKSEVNADEGGSEIHNIGCVMGSNTGKVNGVELAGSFVLNVKGDKANVNASVLIGGIAGQNAAGGEIYDVSPLEDNLTIKITNECVGEFGSYSVGGIVGESTGTIIGVILSDVTIDSSNSKGVTSYIGGIAGQLGGRSASSESPSSTSSVETCIVSGSVKAGTTDKYEDLTSVSYIGGIAGADLGVSVLDCRTAVSVYGSASPNENVVYATGGAFGRILSASTFENLIAYGSALSGPNDNNAATQYIGNFAGIVPKGQTWDGDYATKNILVRTFGNYSPIGAALE